MKEKTTTTAYTGTTMRRPGHSSDYVIDGVFRESQSPSLTRTVIAKLNRTLLVPNSAVFRPACRNTLKQ